MFLFDATYYLAKNPDIAAAVARGETTAEAHFNSFGKSEGREFSPFFSVSYYLKQNPDVAAAVKGGQFTVYDHAVNYGVLEGRDVSPFIDLKAYLAANPDIAAAAKAGLVNPLKHLIEFGIEEGRDLGNGISLSLFANDPEFQNAIQAGDIGAAFQRVAEVAPFLATFDAPEGFELPPGTEIPLDFNPPEGVTLIIPEGVELPDGLDLPDWFDVPDEPEQPEEPQQPEQPQQPNNPGTVEPPASTISGTVVSIAGGASALLTVNPDGSFTISAPGFQSIGIDSGSAANLTGFNIGANAILQVPATAVNGKALAIDGPGKLNIVGVAITEAAGATPFETSANIDKLSFADPDKLLVDGSQKLAYAVRWDTLDDLYVQLANTGGPGVGNPALFGNYTDATALANPVLGKTTLGEAALAVNKAFIELGVDYAAFIEATGQTLFDVTAKASAGGRLQAMHDNILGNLNSAAFGDRRFPVDFTPSIDAEYASRPTYSGNPGDQQGTNHDSVRVFDFERGWQREDYIVRATNTSVDATAKKPNGDMWFGSGNPSVNYDVVRHEGAGIELALDVAYRQGPTVFSTDSAGISVFDVATGTQSTANGSFQDAANRAAWSFNYSVATDLNGSANDRADYTFKLKVDVDKSITGTHFLEFTLQESGGTGTAGSSWKLTGIDGVATSGPTVIADDAGVAGLVSQNSQNFAFGTYRSFISDGGSSIAITDPAALYNYDAGVFDIMLEAYQGTTLLATNHIKVDVGNLI